VVWSEKERPDVICGGFPCQDISNAGQRAGIIKGKRSSLWVEFAKCLRILRPRYALVENVPALANLGLWLVLADLASLGYNAEWKIISAAECGAPHRRERLFVIAIDPCSVGQRSGYNNREEVEVLHSSRYWKVQKNNPPGELGPRIIERTSPGIHQFNEFDCFSGLTGVKSIFERPDIPKPLLRRTDNGLSSKLDRAIWKQRIKALGNAVVPACAELVGRRILELEGERG
jgi:DNA (cytosine-5)-methyltransferase 1